MRATNNFVRNSGDDGLAMWSEVNSSGLVNHNNVYDHNTVQTPVLANNIAIYGGRDNAVTDNLVADPIREGSTLHAGSRFTSTPFEGKLVFARNTTVRGAPRDLNWDLGLGAIWLYALQSDMEGQIEITDSSFLDSTYNAFMFVVDWPVKDEYSLSNVTVRNIRVDGTGTNVVNARVGGAATFENVDARNVGAPFVNNCGTFHFNGPPEFDVHLLEGNDGGWTNGSWCEDRPPVVPPPAPSPLELTTRNRRVARQPPGDAAQPRPVVNHRTPAKRGAPGRPASLPLPLHPSPSPPLPLPPRRLGHPGRRGGSSY